MESPEMISFDEDGSSDGGSNGSHGSVGSDEPTKIETGSELLELQRLQEVDGSVFQEVTFPSQVAQAVQETWAGWIKQAGSKEVAGDLFFTMLFDSAPSLQSAFRSPKAVISMRFMTAFSQLVALLDNPTVLKREIEALAFKHLDLEVTSVKVAFFREALIEVLEESAGDGMPVSNTARGGIYALINYIGSAYIYIHREYAGRIRLVLGSWNAVQKTKALEEGEDVKEEESPQSAKSNKLEEEEEKVRSKEGKDGKNDRDGKDSKDLELVRNDDVLGLDKDEKADNLRVPTSFNEMILFNASVMGYGSSEWIKIMLTHFDDMVRSVANFSRLQEECDVMSLILAKYRGPIELSEFKAVTLASMRSLLPEKWDTDHEVAWSWLWDNIEQLLKATLGKPAVQEAALTRFFERHPEAVEKFKRNLFPGFLELAPAGQEFVKQSSTRLLFISDKIVSLTLEMYRHPIRVVEETSAHGLRHVGYGVPTEMFPPFVSAAVSLIQSVTDNEMVVEAVRWSIALAAKIMVRTLFEGSTLVMKAINANLRNQLKKAMDIIPRGQRASELLKITAGSQSISPFYWAMDSGALTCAQLILEDLLTIRADRDVYYYGADTLFAHHPRVVQRLCATPVLLFTLMDGLVWRSRQTREGWRRVNYYVKNLLQADDDISQNLDWLVHHGDPVIIRHPTVVLFADLLWQGLASYQFLASKLYFLLTLSIFITGQAALFRHERPQTKAENLIMFCCRIVNYLGSMGPVMIHQMKKLFSDIMNHSFKTIGPLMVPRYLLNVQEAIGLALMWLLIIMFTQEPFLWCLSSSSIEVTMACEEAQRHQDLYSCCAFLAMILFWAQLLDLAIFSMQILAYVLVWGRVVGDLALFLLAMCSVTLAFSTSIGSLYAQMPQHTVMGWVEELVLIALRMYPPGSFQHVKSVSTTVFVLLCIFVFIMATFLANLLVAQLTHTYHDAFANMKGFARLKRAGITCATLKDIRLRRRQLFLQSLKLEEPLEFNQGDVGIPGGIQVLEPGSEHVVTEDSIKRFGGPSAPSAPWPREHASIEEDVDKVAQLEKKLIKILKSRGKVPRVSRGSAGSNGSRDDGSSVPTAAGVSMFDD